MGDAKEVQYLLQQHNLIARRLNEATIDQDLRRDRFQPFDLLRQVSPRLQSRQLLLIVGLEVVPHSCWDTGNPFEQHRRLLRQRRLPMDNQVQSLGRQSGTLGELPLVDPQRVDGFQERRAWRNRIIRFVISLDGVFMHGRDESLIGIQW